MELFLKKINSLYLSLYDVGLKSEAALLVSLYLDYLCKEPIVKTSVRKNKIMHLLGAESGRTIGILSPYRSLNSRKENKIRYQNLVRDIQLMGLDTLGNFWHGSWEEDVVINDDGDSIDRRDRIQPIVDSVFQGTSDRAIAILIDFSDVSENQEDILKSLSEDYKEENGELVSLKIRQSKIPDFYTKRYEGPIFTNDSGQKYIKMPASERSVIIKDISFEQIKHLSEKYDQDAFIYRSHDGVTGMYWTGGDKKGHVELATIPDDISEGLNTSLDIETGRLFTKQRRRGDLPSFEYDFWQRDMIPYDGEITKENINKALSKDFELF